MVLDASQCQPGNYAGRPGSEFKEFGSEIKFFPGAVSFQIIFLGQTPVEYKDLILEIY